MTTTQIAANHAALVNAAERVTAIGYTGDAFRFVEALVVSVLTDGYHPLDREPARTGPGSTETSRRAALDAAAAAVRAAKDRTGRKEAP